MTRWLLTGTRWVLVLPALFLMATALASLVRLQWPGLALDLAFLTLLVWGFANAVAIVPAVLFMATGLVRTLTRDTRRQRRAPVEAATRFVVVIPAYNEEKVIRNSVLSLLQQDYPPHLFSVHVACNGVDQTAGIARLLGARVHESSGKGVGKSAAIAELIAATEIPDDAYIVVFDADNLVSAQYLRSIDREVQACGALALQGNHKALATSDNLVSIGLQASYRASSMFYSVGRSCLLQSALFCGTGFALQARLFQAVWKKIRTQTEDIETNAHLQLDYGLGVVWVAEAEFFDEKPDQVVIAIRQRVRWMVGHLHTSRLYSARLFAQGLRHGSWRSIELASYYLFPCALLLSTLWYLLALPAMWVGLGSFQSRAVGMACAGTALGMACMVAMPVIASLLERRSMAPLAIALAIRDALAALVVSLLVWSIAILLAALSIRRRDWIFHTPHKAVAALASSHESSRAA